MNAGLAVAMLRHQRRLAIPEAALRAAHGWAEWPARLQLLAQGPLSGLLPPRSELWLDGGHNRQRHERLPTSSERMSRPDGHST
jgi:dihydrofolate synthase/folylpolyglutamate synthase